MSVSPRNRLIITIVAAALLVIALIAVLVYPQVSQLAQLRTDVEEASAQAQVAKAQLEQRRGFKDRAIETNAKWLRLMNQVPDTPDLSSLIIELQDTAFKSGVQLLSVTPAEPATNAGFWSIPVTVEIAGTWADSVDYMQALIKLDRGLRPMTVNVAGVGSDGEPTRRNASFSPYAVMSNVSIEAYLIPDAPTPAQ